MIIPGGVGKKKTGGGDVPIEDGAKSRAQLDDDEEFDEGLT